MENNEINNFLAPLFSGIAKLFARFFGIYTLVQVVVMFFMPKALWPLLTLELIGPIGATALTYTWHKNMEEEIKEQHKREIMERMEEEGYDIFIEFDEEDEAEFYFENEEAMQALIEKVIAAAKLKAEQEGFEFMDTEEVETEKDTDFDEVVEEEESGQDKKVEHLGLVDEGDYVDCEPPRELIDDDDYNDDNNLGI